MAAVVTSSVVKTPGVCGGDARVADTRIPVWLLVLKRTHGQTDADVLAAYPTLTRADLDAVWDYYRDHTLEVEQTIWLADIATNVPAGSPPPAWVLVAGRLLGLADDEVAQAFDPPATPAQLAAAWREYRADPAQISRRIANLRLAG